MFTITNVGHHYIILLHNLPSSICLSMCLSTSRHSSIIISYGHLRLNGDFVFKQTYILSVNKTDSQKMWIRLKGIAKVPSYFDHIQMLH